jgi:hypothetical protein
MENLEKLESAIKRKDRTKEDIINYLIESQKQMKAESIKFAKTAKFEEIRKRLQALKIN